MDYCWIFGTHPVRKGLSMPFLIFSRSKFRIMKTTKQPQLRLVDFKAFEIQKTAQKQVKGGAGNTIINEEVSI